MNDLTGERSVYSPNQVAAGTFFGGPLAGGYLLWANFKALGRAKQADMTIVITVAVVAAVLAIGFFLDKKLHGLGFGIGLAVVAAARRIAIDRQLDKQTIANSERYSFQSNWKVLGASVVWFFLTVVLAFLIFLALTIYGAKL